MDTPTDKRVIACNYREGTGVATEGALAYHCYTTGGTMRVCILVRSRSGRWVQKWEHPKRLHNFRYKTLPPEHPRYEDDRIMAWHAGEDDGSFDELLERLHLYSEAQGNEGEYMRLWRAAHATA